MKQIITFLGLACTMANAQITITKDNSFGTNGTVTISGVNSSSNHILLIPNIHSTFQGNKIFVGYPSDTGSSTQFTRLNSDGSPDAGFGNSGNVLIPYFESYYFYADNNFFLTNGNKKYLSNGQPDGSFSDSAMQATDWHYKIVLPDGKIFFRDDAGFYKFLPNGTVDSSYGTNGSMAINPIVAGDPNGNSSYEFFFNKDQALYEFVDPSPGQSNIRKVDINTGNLDASYGQGGYAQIKNPGIPSAALHDYSVQASQNDGSFINRFTDSNNAYFTKTNTQGNLDLSVGTNGVITGNKSFIYNGAVYSADDQPLAYNNLIFVPAENPSQELGIACYSLSGNNVTINNNTFYPLAGTSFSSLRFVFVKDNYIYVIHDNNISRFVIQQQQVLSTNELSGKNLNVRVTNPFRDELSVYADEPVKEVEIADINGRILIKGKESNFNTSSLLRGTYFMKIYMASGKVVSKKVLKN